jgi:hypothetical protein
MKEAVRTNKLSNEIHEIVEILLLTREHSQMLERFSVET